jgi:molecular chaperone GrpE
MNQDQTAKIEPMLDNTLEQMEEQVAAAADDAAAADPLQAATQTIAALQQELAQLRDQALRAMADAENTRKRAEREILENSKYAVAPFAKDLLAVTDNLQRAIASIPTTEVEQDPAIAAVFSGILLTEKELLSVLERHHIKRLAPLGEPFNHDHHQAMFEVESVEKPAGTVVELLQAGYTLHQRLLRPALVGVAKGSSSAGDQTASQKLDTSA